MPRFPMSWIGALALSLAVLPASASVSIYMSPEQLARVAALVAEGVVERVEPGYDPEAGTLWTYVTLRLTAVHRGPQQLDRVVLREPGGRIGSLVHDVDAVPVYRPGERVFVFLEPARDGALRTTGLFYGKYVLEAGAAGVARSASRDLQGQGLIFGGPGPRLETIRRSDLIAVTATVRRGPDRAQRRADWDAVPREINRLWWSSPRPTASSPRRGARPALLHDEEPITSRFVPLSWSNPTRWQQADQDLPVTIDVQRRDDPLGDGAAAVVEIERALAAWTAIPEARIAMRLGDADYDYTSAHGASPASRYVGRNVVLFGDPYEDISNPSGCSGVLAIGGYWRSSTIAGTVNNVAFHPALQLYVIFNDGFECFLGDPDNLAEIAAHELGHGLGFGHSDADDSIMRASASGFRGPRLGDDDRDAAHCHYPHRLELTRPRGGEAFEVGVVESITWAGSQEAGPDPGLVDLEYSTDGGASWTPIATDVAHDGHYAWVVPDDPADGARLRVVRPHRSDAVPEVYPESCSGSRSAAFRIFRSTAVAGSIPAGLRLERGREEKLTLSWQPSCSPDADDHAVYEGSLEALRAGLWDHRPLDCSAGADLSERIVSSPGSRYYLVVPLAGGVEGSSGRAGDGALRPASDLACAAREPTAPDCR